MAKIYLWVFICSYKCLKTLKKGKARSGIGELSYSSGNKRVSLQGAVEEERGAEWAHSAEKGIGVS